MNKYLSLSGRWVWESKYVCVIERADERELFANLISSFFFISNICLQDLLLLKLLLFRLINFFISSKSHHQESLGQRKRSVLRVRVHLTIFPPSQVFIIALWAARKVFLVWWVFLLSFGDYTRAQRMLTSSAVGVVPEGAGWGWGWVGSCFRRICDFWLPEF